MSWFSTGLDTLSQLTEKVQQAIPVDADMIAKLTLNTEEMIAERQRFGEEAKRKAEAKDMLSGMLPWETRDSERDILVEECKEAILALSSNVETFFGPYEMPDLPVKDAEVDEKGTSDGKEDHGSESEEQQKASSKNRKPSQESLEKLAKLEPLPPLLGDFDLDTHVGLIQKLLKVDPELVKIQSSLSGGGTREKVFWHNYFFHCAYTRYEAGLSIDEIWSYRPDEATQAEATGDQVQEEAGEETVVFDHSTNAEQAVAAETAFPASDGTNTEPEPSTSGGVGDGENTTGNRANSSPAVSSVVTDFELVGETEGGEDAGGIDVELDELEAEIARELED